MGAADGVRWRRSPQIQAGMESSAAGLAFAKRGNPACPACSALGSPWVAASSSFLAFATGALIPVVPYLLATGRTAFVANSLVCGVSLFIAGALISIFTGRNMLFSGLRMLGIGALATAITYFTGRALGVGVLAA